MMRMVSVAQGARVVVELVSVAAVTIGSVAALLYPALQAAGYL
jgi:hypothetical protein